jgi:hypothetical protein
MYRLSYGVERVMPAKKNSKL